MAHYTIRKFRYGPKVPSKVRKKDKKDVPLPYGKWTRDRRVQCGNRSCTSTNTWRNDFTFNKKGEEVWRYRCGNCKRYFIMDLS